MRRVARCALPHTQGQVRQKSSYDKAKGEFFKLMGKLGGKSESAPAQGQQYIGSSDASELCVKMAQLLNTIEDPAVDVTRTVNEVLSIMGVDAAIDARTASIMKQETRFLEIVGKLAKSSSEAGADVVEVLNAISICCARSGSHRTGIACVQAILRDDSAGGDAATYHARLAAHYNNIGNYEDAKAHCITAQEAGDAGPESYTQLAYSMHRLGDYEGALQALEAMKEAATGTKVPMTVRMDAISLRNAAREALSSATDLLSQLPPSGEIWVAYPSLVQNIEILRNHVAYHGHEVTVKYIEAALKLFSEASGKQVRLFVPESCASLQSEVVVSGENTLVENMLGRYSEDISGLAVVSSCSTTFGQLSYIAEQRSEKAIPVRPAVFWTNYLAEHAAPMEPAGGSDIAYEDDGLPRMRIGA